MNIINISNEIFKDQSFDDYGIDTFIEILIKADDLYHNDYESFLTDTEYDFLRKYAKKLDPVNKYFIGVGSSVRSGEKILLPYQMGSLDQVYENEIDKWVGKFNLGNEMVVLTDKLDGVSAMLVYGNDGDLQIGYSRGDGIRGADIFRHVNKLSSVPNNVDKSIVVRGEVIIEKSTFSFIGNQINSRSGKPYKNPRNFVAGFMNAKENEDFIYDHVKFVAYQIVNSDDSKQEQLNELDRLGFEVVHSLCVYGEELNDENLINHLNLRKQNSVYELDGLVVDVDKNNKRKEMNPTRETLNPAYSIKYKVQDADNIAEVEVLGVEWNISKHGYLKPRVNIKPVELDGVTIEWATGFNAAFILNNGIGPGAVIEITRSGQVIPFILKILTPAVPEMPMEFDWDWEWTVNAAGEKVDAVLKNVNGVEEVTTKRMIDFFDKIDAPMLKEGNVQKLYNTNYKTVEDIIKASVDELVDVLGENGNKVYNGLRDKLTNIPLYKIMGAYSQERGIGVRRMKKLQKALGCDELYKCNDVDIVANVEGFDTKTAEQTVIVIKKFKEFFSDVSKFITIAEDEVVGSTLANMQICFTGIRDKPLADKVEKLGGKVTTSVSGKTTIVVAKDPNSNSGKPKKAREMGITIMNITEFKEMIEEI